MAGSVPIIADMKGCGRISIRHLKKEDYGLGVKGYARKDEKML
jgi:hypothetical protein